MWKEKLYITIAKLLVRFFGLISAIIAIVLLLSLFSFNVNDISFNTASTNEEIKNWMGSFGSYSADLLFQLIGLSSFFLCLILFALGIKIVNKNKVSYLSIKLILLPFCLLSFSVFFASVKDPSWWIFNSLGGVNGQFILSKISFIPKTIITLLFLILSSFLLSIIIDISLSDWKYFFRYTIIIISYITRIIVGYILKTINYISQKGIMMINKLDNKENTIKPQLPSLYDTIKIIKKVSSKANKTQQMIKSMQVNSDNYQLPVANLLTNRSAENKDKKISQVQLEQQSRLLMKVLKDFGVNGQASGIKMGPVVTLYEFEPAAGTKSARIISLSNDIARSMSAVSARISTMSGKNTIGVELPNQKKEIIFLKELVVSREYRYSQATLPIILGKNISGDAMIVDLAKMPHLLIAGTTGSGKSIGVNTMILSLLYKLKPDECKFIMIDPKMLELSVYNGIAHLLAPVVTEARKAITALKWAVSEMEERYRLMSGLNVRNIEGYNEKIQRSLKNKQKLTKKVQTGFNHDSGEPIFEEIELENKKLPFIVIVVDEMADLMLVAGKEIESSVQRLAQMARAAGIHLIMATQRPSVDVITGIIKANFPTRISFQVTSPIDSRTILGTQGAEQLLGQGDMIYMSGGNKMTRIHGPFCSDTEVENVVNFIKSQEVSPNSTHNQNIDFEQIENTTNITDNNDEIKKGDGDLYFQAVAIVKRDKKASISYIQRQLRIGYNRAATLIEKMEDEGIITPPNHSGRRTVNED